MLTELDCCNEADARQSQLGTIVAAYVLFSRLCRSEGQLSLSAPYSCFHAILMFIWCAIVDQTQFDEDVARTSRALSVPEYSFVLELVFESLSSETSEKDLACLVHLSTLLLHETPEGES